MNQLLIKQKLLQDPNSISTNEYKLLLSGKIDPSLLYELNYLLKSNKLNVDLLLKETLGLVKNDDHLLIIAYCLRNGADPNKYIFSNDGKQDIHILAYIYLLYNKSLTSEDELLKNTILIMFLMSGADYNLNYSKSDSKMNVLKYLEKINIKNIILSNNKEWSSILDIKLLIKLSVLLDKPTLLNNVDIINELPLIEIIRDNSLNIFRKYIDNLLPQLNMDKSIEYSIKFINVKIFTILLNFGIYPKYNEINIIILHIINHTNLIREVFTNFIVEYLKRNGKLDSYQSNLLYNNIKKDDIIDLLDKKSIKNSLNVLGNGLLLDGYKIDDNDYIKKKYIGKFKSFGTDQRFPLIHFSNKCIDVIKFGDSIITSDMFEDILNNKKCPYNNTEFSEDIINKIFIRRGLLKRLGYKINKTTQSDNLSNDEFYLKQENAVIEIIKLNCKKDITILPLVFIHKILISLGINIDLLNLLTIEHYKRTFYITIYEMFTINFETTINLFI